jgi:RNA polymerase subunit RPABC4/transcription elongation factor Spt4
MDLTFPKEFDFYMRDPGVRAAFVSENVSPKKTDCPNCGSIGYMYIFVATGGPFRDPTGGKINHWSREGWYTGETKSAVCPVCKAQEYHGEFQENKAEVEKETRVLASRWDLKNQ